MSRLAANDVQRIHFILFHFAADPTTRLISSGRRRLADPKLWEYVTGRENSTEAAHSLFLYATCPPRVSPCVPNAVISVAGSLHGFDGRVSRGGSELPIAESAVIAVVIASVPEENDGSRVDGKGDGD